MTDEERARLAETRRLIFQNLCNGVSVQQAMGAFQLSEKEVRDHFAFVARKIVEYRFRRTLPWIKCGTIGEAIANRVALFKVLANLGAVYLTSDFKISHMVAVNLTDQVANEKLDEMQARQQEAAA